MAKIHESFLIRHHEGDDHAALVTAAKDAAPNAVPKRKVERAVKVRPAETRAPKGKRS